MPTRFIAVLVAATAIAAMAAATARAEPPVQVEKQIEFTRVFADNPGCLAYGYTFTFTEVFQITRSSTDFLDRDGNVLRTVRHIRFQGTGTNDTSGQTLPLNGVRHIELDYVNGTWTETGVLRHVTAPGAGIVLHQSGRLVEGLEDQVSIFEAGPKQLFAGELEAFCAALAGS